MNKVEQIKPYSEADGKTEQVQAMFDSIAPAYDFMNRAMTLGIDKWWRKVARKKVATVAPKRLLDVATGTGDFAIQLHNHLHCSVKGIDLSNGMLEVARKKVADKGLQEQITFEQGDCLRMRFSSESFDAVTVAFGVRNFEHIDRGYEEMYRVIKPGGMLCVLELSTPQNRFIRFFYDLHHSVCGFAEKWRQKRLPLPARKHRSRAARRADARNHAFVRFQALQGAPPHPRCVQHLHRHQIIASRKKSAISFPKRQIQALWGIFI